MACRPRTYRESGLCASLLSALETRSGVRRPRLSTGYLAQRLGVACSDMGARVPDGHQARPAPPILRHLLSATGAAPNVLAPRSGGDRRSGLRVRADGLACRAADGCAGMAPST